MSTIQAKVRCIGNSAPPYDRDGTSGTRTVRFTPVHDPDPEHPNFAWSKATPSGYIELYITNQAASDAFEVDREYLLTFEPQ
jgi:beta-mannanase